jgi:alpha-beta hydrolase superfamily lysophospholipase
VLRSPRSFAALGLAAVVTLGGGSAFERIGASAIVYAPNAGRAPGPAADPAPPSLPAPLVARTLRVDVEPPRAALAVLIVEPPSPRATVFVLHGIRDHKESMLGWGRRLGSAGYRAVLVDARGHGHSSGDFMTYGVVEAHDLSQVLSTLAAQGIPTERVGAMGVSYGAATAIEWSGADPRVAAVVAVAPFASLRAVVPVYARLMLPGIGALLPNFLIEGAIARAGRTGAFDPDLASPADAITRTRAAVLLVHGSADHNIPPTHSDAIHARAPDHSEVVIVDGETHDTIAADKTGVLWSRALEWFQRAL